MTKKTLEILIFSLLILVLVFPILLFQVQAADTISACTTISSPGSYILDTALNDKNHTCIEITTNDVEFDCGGYGNYIDGNKTIGAFGISINSVTENVTIKNCNLTEWQYGIVIASNNVSVVSSSLFNNSYGVSIEEGEKNNISNSSISNSSSRGIWINQASNNIFNDLSITNCSGTGLYLEGSITPSDNNTLMNLKIRRNNIGFHFYDAAPASAINNLVLNSNINDSVTTDIKFEALGGAGTYLNATLLNVTYDSLDYEDGGGENKAYLYFKWYLDIQATYDNSSYFYGSINISDRFGDNLTFNNNNTGWISRQNITEFFANYTDDEGVHNLNRTYFNNYTIHVYNGTNSNLTSVNFSEPQTAGDYDRNYFVNVTFPEITADTTKPLITIHSPTNTTYPAGTTSKDFNVSINEDASWCGFSLDGADNVTMTQFNVTYYNYTKTGLTAGSYNVSFSCNDTSNNFNVTSVVFQIAAATGGGTGEIPGGGGGGTTQPLPYCGDGTCNIDENCRSCPEDCGYPLCDSFVSGSGKFCCEGLTSGVEYDMNCFLETETCEGCEIIGTSICLNCGNGICESCENYCNCPEDCDLCQNLKLDVEVDLGFERQEGFLGMIWQSFMDFILSLFST